MTVFQRISRRAITRLEIFCAEKMQDFQNQHRDWRAVLLQVRTNGLAKYYNISRPGGGKVSKEKGASHDNRLYNSAVYCSTFIYAAAGFYWHSLQFNHGKAVKFGRKILRSDERDCWRDMCCCLRHWYSCLNLVLTVCNWHAYYWINLNGSIETNSSFAQ